MVENNYKLVNGNWERTERLEASLILETERLLQQQIDNEYLKKLPLLVDIVLGKEVDAKLAKLQQMESRTAELVSERFRASEAMQEFTPIDRFS